MNSKLKTLSLEYYKDKGKEYLFWQDRPNHAILWYDINKEKLIRKIAFIKEGPGEIPVANAGFSVLGLKSILLGISKPGVCYQVDTSGAVKEKIYFTDSIPSLNNTTLLNSRLNGDVVRLESKLFVPLRYPFFRKFPGEQKLSEVPVFSIVDLNDKSIEKVNFDFVPSVYDDNKRPLSATNGINSDGKNLYFYFACDHNIYQYDGEDKYTVHPVFSKYHQDYRPFNDEHHTIRFTRSFLYRGLYYDEYRQIFYRIVKLPVMEPLDDYYYEDDYPSRFSVMVMDKNLKKIGEVLFANTEYSMLHVFVGKAGLFLMRAPRHSGYKEGQITFDAFTFEEI